MWKRYTDLCPVISITNAQSFDYWGDKTMYEALHGNDDKELIRLKLLARK
jgi:glycogen phosphorylase